MEVGSEVLSVITQCLREQHSEYDYYSKHIILVFKHFIMPINDSSTFYKMKEIEFLCKQNGQRLMANPSPLNSVDNITSFLNAI